MLTVPTSKKGQRRILGFDIENMPLTYYAPDYPTAQITVIGSAWADDPKGTLQVCMLGEESFEEVLIHFVERYEEADMVTGHYIRKHDLPIINGALAELGMQTLGQKLTSDTKMDLVRWSALPKNQEYLASILKVGQQKLNMTQADWRDANRFLPAGLKKVRARASTDVIGQLQMRDEMIRRGLLKSPRVWRP